MKRICVFFFVLSIMISALCAGIAFDEPIPIFETDNIDLSHEPKLLPNGNLLLTYSRLHMGISVPHLQEFTTDYQPVWQEPLRVPNLFDVAIHTDGKIAVLREHEIYSSRFVLDTYDPAGNPVAELSEIDVFYAHSKPYCRFNTDNAGGVHFLAGLNGLVRYMHVDAQGNLYSPQFGIDLMEGTYYAPSALLPTPDGGAMVAIPRSGRLTVFKIGPDHELDWSTDFEDIYVASKIKLNPRQDGSSYVVWQRNNRIYSQLVSSTGQKLWDQEFTPPSGLYQSAEGSAVSTSGELILHYHCRDLMHATAGLHCYIVIDATGETLYSHTPQSEPNGMVNPYQMSIFPQSAGGWFLLARKDTEFVNPGHYIQYYDSTYQPWPQIQTASDPFVNTIFAYSAENELNLIFLEQTVEESGIYAQGFDTEANLVYPEQAYPLFEGRRITASAVQALALSSGPLFLAWREYSGPKHRLMYQIISPSGSQYLSEPQTITEDYVQHFSLFETSAGEVLIVWFNSYGMFFSSTAQLISLSAGILWEEGGKVLKEGSPNHSYSFWNNSLYLASQSNGGDIYLQRYDAGYPVWGGNGILLGTLHPDYYPHTIYVQYFADNQICWSQKNLQTTEMVFTNFFYEDGSTLYTPDQAAEAAVISGDYVGAWLRKVHKSQESIIYEMGYLFWEFIQEGHSDPGSWVLVSSNYLQRINPDGSMQGEALAFPFSIDSILLIQDNTVYLAGYSQNYIQACPIGEDYVWDLYLPATWFINRLSVLPDQRFLIQARTNAGEQHYAYLDAAGNFEQDPDSRISSLPCQDVLATDLGVWFVLSNTQLLYNNTSGFSVQYLEHQTWSIDDPQTSPTPALHLQNYPNPFGESTEICVKLQVPAPIKLSVYNLRGQLVKSMRMENGAKGNNYLVWDGKDSTGRNCSTGIYFLKAESQIGSATLKTVKMR